MNAQSESGTTRSDKVLVIVSVFPPLGRVGASIRIVKFLRYADPNRWKFIVVTSKPGSTVIPILNEATSILEEIPANVTTVRRGSFLRIPRSLLEPREQVGGSASTKSGGTVKSGFLKRLKMFVKTSFLVPDEDILWVISNFWFCVRLVIIERPSVLYVAAPQYSSLILGALLAKMFGIPLIVDIRDDWYENGIRQRKPGPVMAIERLLERSVLKIACKILVPTETGIHAMKARMPDISDVKYVHIQNGVDLEEFRDRKQNAPDRNPKCFTFVSAAGGISPTYRDIAPFLRAVYIASRSSNKIRNSLRVVFLGTDVRNDYRPLLEELSISEQVTCVNELSRSQYVRWLRSADCLLLVQMDNAESSVPGTLYEYAAAGGVPVFLVGGKGATAEYVKNKNLGWAFAPADVEGMAARIRRLIDNWKKGNPTRIVSSLDLAQIDRKQGALKFQRVLEESLVK